MNVSMKSLSYGIACQTAAFWGGDVSDRMKTVLIACEASVVGGALLVLPTALIDLAFGTDLLGLLAQALLVAVTLVAIFSSVAIHQGWFGDYYSENRTSTPLEPERQDPTS
jgi:hypothetical protein